MPTPHAIRNLLTQDLHRLLSAHLQGAVQAETNLSTATFPPLLAALKAGAKQSRKQAKRLGAVMASFDLPATPVHDPDMQGIADANNDRIAHSFDPIERDLIHITYGQLSAHLYIARYGTLRAYARELGNKKAAKLLTEGLNNASLLDAGLTKLAKARIVAARASTPATTEAGTKPEGDGFLPIAIAIAGIATLGVALTRASQPD